MADSAIQDTVQKAEEFAVVPELCIACDACCQDFPEIFYMGDDQKAHAHESHPWEMYNARTVVDVCPTSAITFSGELPPPEDLSKLEEVEGWELEWARWRGVEEDEAERDRRYGRDYEIAEHEGYVHVKMRFPRRVPAVRDRFRYGLPDEMPLYRSHVQFENGELLVAGWLTDPKIRALTHTSRSFPAQFMTTLPFKDEQIVGYSSRYDAHAELEVVLFTDPVLMETWKWKSHFITEKCTACTICERVCPTNAITSGEIFYIDPDLCINCSVCGVYCPFDAIDDNRDVTVQRIKAKKIPKAVVHEELCTGCEFCVDICPFDAIEMVNAIPGDFDYQLPQNQTIAHVKPKQCVSCKLCEQVCIKDAIEVPRQHQFENIGMSFMNYVTDNH